MARRNTQQRATTIRRVGQVEGRLSALITQHETLSKKATKELSGSHRRLEILEHNYGIFAGRIAEVESWLRRPWWQRVFRRMP